jgi:hypothetical protein
LLQVSGSLSAIESFVQNAKTAGALPYWPSLCQLDAGVGKLEKPQVHHLTLNLGMETNGAPNFYIILDP